MLGRFFFLFVIFIFQVHGKEPESLGFIKCKKHELEALLKFKQSFTKDPLNRLFSWVGNDCCLWHGVTCNNVTYNVVKLNLRSQRQLLYDSYSGYDDADDDAGCLPDYRVSIVSYGLSSALLDLKLLTHLDLSGNDFSGSHIPKFIGSLRHLRYLNLSFAGFSGPLPPQLGNLTNLVHLNLHSSVECFYLDTTLYAEEFRWASGLLKLQSLDLSGCNMSLVHDTFKVLSTLPSLSALSLSSCVLGNSHLSETLIGNTSNSYFSNLQHLDLDVNGFGGPFPSFLKNMISLRSLSLYGNNFNGSVPLWFRAMKRLEILDLGYNYRLNYVEGGIMGIMGNPCNFKHLALSNNNITQRDIIEPSMSLSGCSAFDLEYLALSHNEINGSLPSLLGRLTNLNYLDLSYNMINGSLSSSLGRLTNLNYLDLSGNKMSGSSPSSLGRLTNLNYLDLSYNMINGSLPSSLGRLTNLNYLDLTYNMINGSLSSSLGRLTNLNYLDLSSNNLKGQIPASFVKLSALKYLDLSYNQLSGLIPDFIRNLTQIGHLDISSNSLQGSVFGIGNLSKLSYLDMSLNYLHLNHLDTSLNWRPSFQLSFLFADSCVINTVFPQWLRNQTRIKSLDLSNTGISGELPGWLWNSSSLQSIYLSGNRLTGSLPQQTVCDGHYSSCNLAWLDLHNNLLTGTIPKWLGHLENAEGIDLSSNRLTGAIFVGNNASSLFNIGNFLRVLDLSNNKFSGEIQLGKVPPDNMLQAFSVRGNHFNGPIHPQFCEFKSLLVLDLAQNCLIGHIPRCLGTIAFDYTLVREDTLGVPIVEIVKGIAEVYTGIIRGQSIIDLSSNYLVGIIPEELSNISTLFALNLSYNQLTGPIPENIGNLKTVESLDLSNNHLSGTIPQSLSSISWLTNLNLSNNNLHGVIPTGRQLQTLDDPSIYANNSGLCGFPLPNNCTKSALPPSSTNVNLGAGKDDTKKKDKYEKLWFILAVMYGVATGFWGVVGTLVIKRSWRQAYFGYVEDLGDRICVPIKVRVNRFKRRFNANSNTREV